ncbi:unnamed protein product, partial [marine sediment metagenome]
MCSLGSIRKLISIEEIYRRIERRNSPQVFAQKPEEEQGNSKP